MLKGFLKMFIGFLLDSTVLYFLNPVPYSFRLGTSGLGIKTSKPYKVFKGVRSGLLFSLSQAYRI